MKGQTLTLSILALVVLVGGCAAPGKVPRTERHRDGCSRRQIHVLR